MIDERTIFEIHRLHNEGLSIRKIARKLSLSRDSVAKYLDNPVRNTIRFERPSKLDPFKDEIGRLLEISPEASSEVIRQRLVPLGFDGGSTILKDYLRTLRASKRRAFIRFESAAGEQMQVDWGHFGSLTYGNTSRKLSCLAMIESHSRMLYLEFTHSQRQEALHRALLNGFLFFNGAPRTLVVDNMITAVIERDGPLIRFNEAFLSFLRPFKTVPRACNVRSPHEKGKVEKGAIHYIRYNFWPLRFFKDLADVQSQANQWRDQIANVRRHNTTAEKPIERFRPETLLPLPPNLPDCRDLEVATVHTDFCIHFDANTYTVPPHLIGKEVTVKADHQTVTIYFKDEVVANHARSWLRRHRAELPSHCEAAQRHPGGYSDEAAALMGLGEPVKAYLERFAATDLPLKKNLQRLLALKDDYGSAALCDAITQAAAHNAIGADYIENILYQQMAPRRIHPPVHLRDEALNRIRLDEPSLAEYDAFILKRKKIP
ncbi:IS21 family transposase [Desulforhabdus sp. TSK]|uniref:IS21 family transposase n=1 Tax=Desulforhabdus sp. TSK TaxID=2925014 RepID=UPI001FC87B19|nr:IS21 family transposase [Desulforhabdus sp. TSK]GKT10997.1 IS21 family transposase [Desulforhabdus sp. TSK]